MDDVSQGRFSGDGRWLRPPLSPESWAARSQAMQWIADCMAALPDRRRLVFELRDVQQLGTEEICKILDVSPNTLGVLLFRARNALRECMEAKGMRGSDDVAM
jgi:RNA polymerase sigma-70 factor (ECF subfamily)